MEPKMYKDKYLIYPDGTVENPKTKNVLKTFISTSGYLLVSLSLERYQNVYLHKILAETFIPNPNNYLYVRHIDGNRLNNDLANLEWYPTYSPRVNPTYTFDEKYEVFPNGQILNKLTNTYLQQGTFSNGYISVMINLTGKQTNRYVHRLVAEKHLPKPEYASDQVRHINGDKTDNRVENLEWIVKNKNKRVSLDKPFKFKDEVKSLKEIVEILEKKGDLEHL